MKFLELFHGEQRSGADLLRARFARFRHLIEMNNRVLRLIADADEKLGGEYLFDTQYFHHLESELSHAATAAVNDLAEMSGNRYPGLTVALDRVQSRVRGSLDSQRSVRDLPLTFTIDDLGTELADVVQDG